MAIRVSHSSSSSLRRPLKSSRSLAAPTTTPASANVPFVYFVLLLSTLLVTAGPLSVVNGLPTQQQQQQQQEKYGRSSAAAEQNLAEQMILAEPPQLQVGKPSPYDLVSGSFCVLICLDLDYSFLTTFLLLLNHRKWAAMTFSFRRRTCRPWTRLRRLTERSSFPKS